MSGDVKRQKAKDTAQLDQGRGAFGLAQRLSVCLDIEVCPFSSIGGCSRCIAGRGMSAMPLTPYSTYSKTSVQYSRKLLQHQE